MCYIIRMEIENLEEKQKDKSWWELLRFGLIALVIVAPIRLFIAQPFVVSGSSMVPTFIDKDYLIVDEITYKFNDPKRDDVIIFRYPLDKSKFFIKRIIGLPGETVDIKGSVITITNGEHKDGLVLDQPYVKNQKEDTVHTVLKDNEYFVMGDNRSASSDSRYWGAVPRKNIVGRALLRLLPFGEMGILPGKYTQTE
jgi:signal peptidase I